MGGKEDGKKVLGGGDTSWGCSGVFVFSYRAPGRVESEAGA